MRHLQSIGMKINEGRFDESVTREELLELLTQYDKIRWDDLE